MQKPPRRPSTGRPKGSQQQIHPQMQRILQIVPDWQHPADVYRGLGRDASTMTRRMKRGDGVPEDWLWQVGYLFDARIEWLRTGEGAIYRDDPRVSAFGPAFVYLSTQWAGLGAAAQQLLLRVVGVVRDFGSVLDAVVGVMERAQQARNGSVVGWLQAASPAREPDEPTAEAGEDD